MICAFCATLTDMLCSSLSLCERRAFYLVNKLLSRACEQSLRLQRATGYNAGAQKRLVFAEHGDVPVRQLSGNHLALAKSPREVPSQPQPGPGVEEGLGRQELLAALRRGHRFEGVELDRL